MSLSSIVHAALRFVSALPLALRRLRRMTHRL